MLSFWEDPALLIGVPLLALGAFGALITVGALVSYWIKPS